MSSGGRVVKNYICREGGRVIWEFPRPACRYQSMAKMTFLSFDFKNIIYKYFLSD